jgi:hypothetical protein
MARRPDDRPVVGLSEDGSGSDQAAREIRARGIRAGVTSGTDVAEGRVGSHLVRGLVIGVLIALPFAIVLPLIAWTRINVGVGPLLLALPILFVGTFLGMLNQAARRDGKSMWKRSGRTPGCRHITTLMRRSRAKLVVAEPALNPPATDQATTIINEAGGEMIRTPKPGE